MFRDRQDEARAGAGGGPSSDQGSRDIEIELLVPRIVRALFDAIGLYVVSLLIGAVELDGPRGLRRSPSR
jgi:hypothetical protein